MAGNPHLDPEVQRNLALKYAESLATRNVEADRAFIDGILEEIKEPNKMIPEPVFRELFLPYFIGERKMTKNENALAHWMGLVGSPTISADVVDMTGKRLFTVPPVMDTESLNTLNPDRGRSSFAATFINFQEQSKLHANLGRMELAEGLAAKTLEIMPDGQPKPNNGWDECIDYYRKQGLIKDTSPEAVAAAAAAVNNDDDLVFGDD